MYRYIASCVVLALVASSAHGVVVSTSSQTTPFVVSSTDLIQTNLSSTASTGVFNQFGAAGLPVLNNGLIGAATTNSFADTAFPNTNATVTYTLNTAASPFGYQITSVDTFGEWDDGRDRQNVSISFSTVSNPGLFTTIATYQFEPPGPSPNFSRVNVTPDGGQTILADNVAAVRFSFPTQENNGGGYRELDVFGTISTNAVARHVPLQNATAFGSQPGFAVGNLLDNNSATGWADDLTQANFTPPNTAVFETVSDVGEGEFTFSFQSGGFGLGNHTAGKFRLSVTGDDRSTFADGLANGGDVDANWVVLDITSATSTNPTTILTELTDGSILASGANANLETYTIKANNILGTVTGFRLEMLEDPSLPNGGPGRAGNGNYVIYDFNVAFNAIPEPATAMLGLIGAAGLMFRRRRVA